MYAVAALSSVAVLCSPLLQQSLPEEQRNLFCQRSLTTDPVEYFFSILHQYAGVNLSPDAVRSGFKRMLVVLFERYNSHRGYKWGREKDTTARSGYFGTCRRGSWHSGTSKAHRRGSLSAMFAKRASIRGIHSSKSKR